MTGFIGRCAASVGEIDANVWEAFLPDEAEGHAYYRACDEAAAASGVGFRSAAAVVEDGQGIAAMAPFFRLDYRLDTPLQGRLRRIADGVLSRFPNLVTLKAICVGSPYAERCHIGFAPRLDGAARQEAARAMLAALERQAAAEKAHLIAFKDLAPAEDSLLSPVLGNFALLGSLPIAALELPFDDRAAYLASLSSATRKDIRRKLAKAEAVRIEHRSDISGVEDSIAALYESTRRQSELDYGDFEILPPGYFLAVSKALGERAIFMLYWVGEELAAFNLLLVEPDRVIDKFLGMRYPLARAHNLYALSWVTNVQFCIARGIGRLQSGQTAYASKLRLGSHLIPSMIRFRHRSTALQWALRLISPHLSFARFDSDLVPRERRRR